MFVITGKHSYSIIVMSHKSHGWFIISSYTTGNEFMRLPINNKLLSQ